MKLDQRANIDNGNDNFFSRNSNVNENNVANNGSKGATYERSKAVDIIALDLCERLGNRDSYKFYCKVAWRLQPSVIYNNLEQALKGREPAKLFTYLCKKCLGD